MTTKKLIEVALPLEKINAESAHEKNIKNGHPANLHLWWARRPITTARAVIWSSIVDDPSSHPELFPSEEAQNKERQRLFDILEALITWDNLGRSDILNAAQKELKKYSNGTQLKFLDLFAGGGAIPLEAQRLGLKAYAHDLNPVPVMLNKAMIEIPARFEKCAPVNPDNILKNISSDSCINGVCIPEDVKYYGEWMLNEARKKLEYMYPQVVLPVSKGGKKAPVIAWIWSRTVDCANPACNAVIPLVSSFTLSQKKGREAWAEPVYNEKGLSFEIHEGKCPKEKASTKQGKSAIFKCPVCGEVTTDAYVKEKGKKGEIGIKLMAIAADCKPGRAYVAPSFEQENATRVELPDDYPTGSLPNNPRWFSPPAFGMTDYSDLFTKRQMLALTTFSDLVKVTQREVERDAIVAGLKNDHIHFKDGGTGALAYGEAISVYLSFLVDKLASLNSSLCPWGTIAECPLTLFGRQAIPMVWDFAESNPIGDSSGSFSVLLNGLLKTLKAPAFSFHREHEGIAVQHDAQSDCGLSEMIISTDPPYYDNIGYADLSDFFYIWIRRSLKSMFPDIFTTMLVPKAEELVATPYRFEGGMEEAKEFFESGMLTACKQMYRYVSDRYPLTIYYAYKQNDSKTTTSSGWETMLSAIINAGFVITGTWPMHTERETGLKASVNALASSIVLVCRKRSKEAGVTTRRNIVNELKRELRPALKKLQASSIAPVDLAQSAIGPGMGVYSKYDKVLEADGTPMSVRSALQVINQELDLYFNEQDGELDTESRFCVDLYSQMAFNEMPFGDANTLATAKNTSVAIMASHGTLYAQKGKVHLIERPELPTSINEHEGSIWLLCQQLTHRMEKEGIEGCAAAIANMYGSNAERAKDLAYRLYTIAERKKWAQEAYAYNALVVAWPEIQSRAAELKAIVPQQLTLGDFMNNNN